MVYFGTAGISARTGFLPLPGQFGSFFFYLNAPVITLSIKNNNKLLTVFKKYFSWKS